MATPALKTLLLGLGNDLLTDDAVGLHVAAELANDTALADAGVTVIQTTEMGLALLDFVTGYDRLFIVDAIQTGHAEPGTLHILRESDLKTVAGVSTHFLGVGEMLELGRVLGLQLPSSVTILAIEVADPFTMGTHLTACLDQRLPDLIAATKAEITGGVSIPNHSSA